MNTIRNTLVPIRNHYTSLDVSNDFFEQGIQSSRKVHVISPFVLFKVAEIYRVKSRLFSHFPDVIFSHEELFFTHDQIFFM